MGTFSSIAIALIGIGVGILALFLLALEIQYHRRPGNKLDLTIGNWQVKQHDPQRCQLVGQLEFINRTQQQEIMVPELGASARLFSSGNLNGVTTHIRMISGNPDVEPRADGYWEAQIIKRKPVPVEAWIDISGENLEQLRFAWIQFHYTTYGPSGRIPKTRHVIVPLSFPDPAASKNWRSTTNSELLPIRTHLLTHLDSPVEVVQRYVAPHAQPGDVVTIGESPIAIMQDRFRHPTDIRPGWVATRLCNLFLPTSSLATACGMQALIDIVGPVRVLFAFLIGSIAKAVLRKPGVFYQLAGEQARLIDDVTGTLPPYDQFIVLGPRNPQRVVDQIKQETGLAAAIVDVNDLRAVKVLAATADIPPGFLQEALITNPAGNANEQTPIVLLRPKSVKSS